MQLREPAVEQFHARSFHERAVVVVDPELVHGGPETACRPAAVRPRGFVDRGRLPAGIERRRFAQLHGPWTAATVHRGIDGQRELAEL